MHRYFSVFILACALAVQVEIARGQSVEHLLLSAIKHSAELEKARAVVEVAHADVSLAQASWLPQISARLYNGVGDTQQSNPLLNRANTSDDIQNNSISLQQSIYNRPTWIQIERTHLAVREAEIRLLQATQKLIQQWFQQLMVCKHAELAMRLAQRRWASTALQLDQTRYLKERGEASPLDVLNAITEHLLRQAEMDEATIRLTHQLQVLSRLTALPLETSWLENIDFKLPSNSIDLASAEQGMLETNPDLLIHRTYIESAELGIDQARSQHHPTAALLVQNSQSKSETVSTLGNRVNQNVVALQVNIPLFNGFGTLAGTEKAVGTLNQQKAEFERIKTEAINALHAARQQMEASKMLADAYDQAMQSTDLQGKAIKTAILHQLATPLDLARLQEKNIELQMKKLDRVINAKQAYITVLVLKGQLTAQVAAQQVAIIND